MGCCAGLGGVWMAGVAPRDTLSCRMHSSGFGVRVDPNDPRTFGGGTAGRGSVQQPQLAALDSGEVAAAADGAPPATFSFAPAMGAAAGFQPVVQPLGAAPSFSFAAPPAASTSDVAAAQVQAAPAATTPFSFGGGSKISEGAPPTRDGLGSGHGRGRGRNRRGR